MAKTKEDEVKIDYAAAAAAAEEKVKAFEALLEEMMEDLDFARKHMLAAEKKQATNRFARYYARTRSLLGDKGEVIDHRIRNA